MGAQWLSVGLQLWQTAPLAFDRDYFLPLPSRAWDSVQNAMADYGDVVGLSKQLFRRLRQPVWQQGVWRPSSQPLFIAEAAFSFWTEHSERNWLVSLLAALGVPHDDRKFIGRWLATSAADEYLRTAQQVIINLQEKLVCALKGEDRWDLRNTGLEELTDRIKENGDTDLAKLQQQLLYLHPRWGAELHVQQTLTVTEFPTLDAAVDEDDDLETASSPYFVTIVGSKQLKRLHRRGGCGVSVIDVQRSEPVWCLKGLLYDLACKHCWRAGENITVSEAEEADDSEPSSGSAPESYIVWLRPTPSGCQRAPLAAVGRPISWAGCPESVCVCVSWAHVSLARRVLVLACSQCCIVDCD